MMYNDFVKDFAARTYDNLKLLTDSKKKGMIKLTR